MFARSSQAYAIAGLALLVLFTLFLITGTAKSSVGWPATPEWSVPAGGAATDRPKSPAATPPPPSTVQKIRPTVQPVLNDKLEFNPFDSSFDIPATPLADPAGPKPHQIALLTAGDGKGRSKNVQEMTSQALENRREYCNHHGYVFSYVDMSKYNLNGDHAVWGKIPAIIETFQRNPEVEWIWWLDLDAIIMSPKLGLAENVLSEAALEKIYRPERHFVLSPPVWHNTPLKTAKKLDYRNTDLVISQDQNGLNAGSFFIRRSAFTQLLLDLWTDRHFIEKGFIGKEQDALLHLALNHAVVRSHIAIVQQNSINGYLKGGGEMGWAPGRLVIHLAGCWTTGKCEERWREFWNKRERLSG